MDLAERVSTLRRVNNLSARQLAALVGVAPTTVTRIESGAVMPSFDLAREILAVLGEPIGFTGSADVAAIAAARLAVDATLEVEVNADVEVWRQRWARIGLVDEAGRVVQGKTSDLLFRAGRAARLTRRRGAEDFAAGPGAREIAEVLGEAGVGYAVTGDAGANSYCSSASEVWPVLYVENVARAAEAVGLERKSDLFGLRVTLVPFDGICEVGRSAIDGMVVAARDQVAIDAYGGIDRMAEQADILLRRRTA